MFGLQQGDSVLQRVRFLCQCERLNLVLMMQFGVGFLCLRQLRIQRGLLLIELGTSLVDGLLGLFFEALRKARNQRSQLIIDGFGWGFCGF